MSDNGLNMSRRIRRTPFTSKVEQHGVRGFSVVNHMLLPKAFNKTVEEDYWHLREHVQIWDVSVQRQVQISGKDSKKLIQLITPRNISTCEIGKCMYLPITDQYAGMINDPVLLMLDENKFWLSIADSDVLLYCKGIAIGKNLDVRIYEPDVSPLAIQGPKSFELMAEVFGDKILNLKFYQFSSFDFLGTKQIVARSGYSKQGGFEIYLSNSELGNELWDAIWDKGQKYNLSPGCPNLIERIEGGLLSYGNEFTIDDNPLECGLENYCSLNEKTGYIAFDILREIQQNGIKKKICGIKFDGPPTPSCTIPYPVLSETGRRIGQITSGIYSPRFKLNIGLSMIERNYWNIGNTVLVETNDTIQRKGEIVSLPMI